jgi:hypothetical protein
MRQNRVSITLLVSVISSWSADLEQFEKVIRPALVGHCVECHGPEKQKGGLRLDSRAGWMTGGDSGPAIIPGKPDESLLFRAISYERADTEMPPKGRLPEDLIRGFRQWILSGAPDPREGVAIAHRDESPTLAEGRRFWSFQPVNPPAVPKVQNAGWTSRPG